MKKSIVNSIQLYHDVYIYCSINVLLVLKSIYILLLSVLHVMKFTLVCLAVYVPLPGYENDDTICLFDY